MAADFAGPEDELVAKLKGIDVIVSAINAHEQHAQIPLATAAKKAGVKRFLPCGFITVAPPGGIMALRDWVSSQFRFLRAFQLLTYFVTERRGLQPSQADRPTIHDSRRRLVVPDCNSPLALGKDRLFRGKPSDEHPDQRWQHSERLDRRS